MSEEEIGSKMLHELLPRFQYVDGPASLNRMLEKVVGKIERGLVGTSVERPE